MELESTSTGRYPRPSDKEPSSGLEMIRPREKDATTSPWWTLFPCKVHTQTDTDTDIDTTHQLVSLGPLQSRYMNTFAYPHLLYKEPQRGEQNSSCHVAHKDTNEDKGQCISVRGHGLSLSLMRRILRERCLLRHSGGVGVVVSGHDSVSGMCNNIRVSVQVRDTFIWKGFGLTAA